MTTVALLDSLERTSRNSAILMALGVLIVAAALALSTQRLKSVQDQVTALETRSAVLMNENNMLQTSADQLTASTESLRAQVGGLRKALSASRDAIAAFHAHDYTGAVNLYDAALEADPGNAYVLNLKAYSLYKLGQVANAINVQKRGIATDPGYAWGFFDLARFQCAAGDKSSAAKSLADAQSKDARFRQLSAEDGEFRRLCGILKVD